MSSLQAVPANQGGIATTNEINHQVDTIWQMATASFASNSDQIVLPLHYEKSLSAVVVEELKARLSRHIGQKTFSVADPVTSTFRIFGLNAAALGALTELGSSKISFAGTPLESLLAQGPHEMGRKTSTGKTAMKQQASKEKQTRIPRPPNAFILYRQEYHPIIKAQHPDFHNNDISKVLGKQWKEESPAVREMYKAKAVERKAQHCIAYPNYQYAPRKPGEKKRRTSRKDIVSGIDKEQYHDLRFIDQEQDSNIGSESGTGDGDDDMEVIGTNAEEGIHEFHLDGNGNIGVVFPVAENAYLKAMVEAQNDSAVRGSTFDPADDVQVTTTIPPHVQKDNSFFDTLIDWDAIAEDFKMLKEASGEELAGLANIETGNPYLSLSDEAQREIFEAELERTLHYFE